MSRQRFRLQVALVFVISLGCGLDPAAPAWAQPGEGWSFVLTPQVWVSHIAKNGFGAAPNASQAGPVPFFNGVPSDPNTPILQNVFDIQSTPNETVNPQWGLQFAAQKGRLTLAGTFQYVTYETRNDITWVGPGTATCPLCPNTGDRWAQEFVDTTRMDVDLSATYFFPDVVKDWLDVSVGTGFKFIYASASREYGNLSPQAQSAAVSPITFGQSDTTGLYTVCTQDNCPFVSATAKSRVKEKSQVYGVTFPMNATLHLSNDAKWLLPFSVTPLIGAEIRNDQNVVYSSTLPATIGQYQTNGFKVNRLDGTAFAYGVTSDLSIRWIITDTVSAYAGMRVQYINGQDTYLAYGPLLGMSVRFGGK